jgi:hypothetical protein
MNKLIFTIILILSIFGCQEDSIENCIWFSYAETGGLDKWRGFPHSTDSELANAVTRYLNEQDITICDIKIGFDSLLYNPCYAAHCTTGRYIHILSNIENRVPLTQLGFLEMK